jgi:hypothetical protein
LAAWCISPVSPWRKSDPTIVRLAVMAKVPIVRVVAEAAASDVTAVITMMEIGQGSKTAIQKTIASMGANNLMVQSGAATSSGVSQGLGSVLTLTP